MRSRLTRIVIIGAGFSGTIAAVRLLRSAAFTSLDVVLLNRCRSLAGGLAYGTRSSAHVLNVPAARMGAFPEDETGFLRFVQLTHPQVGGGDFLPRSWYGAYLESLLTAAERTAARGVSLTRILGEAIGLSTTDDGRGMSVRLNDGRILQADRVVLACGNFAPPNPDACICIADSPRYIRDPWLPGAISSALSRAPVLLVGSGLTMSDIALSIDNMGGTEPIYAISRRGVLPHPHRQSRRQPVPRLCSEELSAGPPTARSYLSTVRRQIRAAVKDQIDWRDVVAALRPITPGLWQRLSTGERARFLRHLRPYWDAHRHRAAPATARAVQRLINRGRLFPLAGRLISCAPTARGLAAEVRLRGSRHGHRISVGTIVNCIGPDTDVRRIDEPLIRSLYDQGWLKSDPLGLGIETGDCYEVVDASGRPSRLLFYLGPLLKCRYWESTAVPELRVHAAQMINALIASVQHSGTPVVPRSETNPLSETASSIA